MNGGCRTSNVPAAEQSGWIHELCSSEFSVHGDPGDGALHQGLEAAHLAISVGGRIGKTRYSDLKIEQHKERLPLERFDLARDVAKGDGRGVLALDGRLGRWKEFLDELKGVELVERRVEDRVDALGDMGTAEMRTLMLRLN
eukprot:SAG11_NODE_1680_length_4459_cov_1.671101_2_plen_142_part_00